MNLKQTNQKQFAACEPITAGGLAVRTNLRAGFAWDDLDDQAKALWDQLTNAVSSVTASSDATTTTPAA